MAIPTSSRASAPASLQITALIDEGLSYAEIGKRIYIEQTTVKWYVQEMYDKLGLQKPHRNQKKLIAHARELGLLQQVQVDIPRNNLPAQTTRFIGREQELADLEELIVDPNVRLITILAPGGMGKSRLALEMGEHVLGDYARTRHASSLQNGVFFVSLAPINSPENIPNVIATATGFQFMSDEREPKQQILDYLSNKKMLLIMDNYEHVLDGAGLVTEILQAAPDVQIVATSRERLSLSGEKVYTIGGMEFPDWETPQDALEYNAVQLFIQGARLAVNDFDLQVEDLKFLAHICRLVEGMPLAIVLAAAWVEVLSLQEIADEITQSVDFLAAEMRDVPRRQWSIRAVFEPTWERLTEKQQTAFMRMSVFRGGATRKAAQSVTGVGLPTLQALVNKSLITRSTERNPAGRYNIHEMLRQFAKTKLDECGEMDAIRDAHSEYYLNALDEREADLKGHDQLSALNDIESDFENVKAAWSWAVEQRNYNAIDRAVECLDRFCVWRRPRQDGIALFGQAREVLAPQPGEEPHPVWGKVLLRFHEDNYTPGKNNKPRIEQCLAIARKHGDQKGIAVGLHRLGIAVGSEGDRSRAIALTEESLNNFRALGDKYWMVHLLLIIANHTAMAGKVEKSIKFTQQSLDLARETGNRHIEAANLHDLGVLAWLRGDNVDTEHYFRKAYAIRNDLGGTHIAISASALGDLAYDRGDFKRAGVFFDEANDVDAHFYGSQAKRLAATRTACLELVPENYAEARRLWEMSREHYASVSDSTVVLFLDGCISLAAGGLGDYPAACRSMQASLKIALNLFGVKLVIVPVLRCLPAAAIIEANTGDIERSVELLGLAFSYPKELVGWMEKWPLLTRLRADLKSELGEEAYNAAWERGKSLDLETVVKELLEEFAED